MPVSSNQLPEPAKKDDPSSKGYKRPSVMRCLQLAQKFSAYGFTLFAGMHLVGVIVAPVISPHLGDQTILFTRTVYQSTLGEPLLVYGTALVHLAAGAAVRVKRALQNKSKGFLKQLKPSNPIQKSGVLLTLLSLGHWIGMRGGVVFYGNGDSSGIDLGYVKYLLQDWTAPLSLVLLTATYTYHAVGGMNMWLRLRMTLKKRLLVVSAVSILSIISLVRIGQLPLATGWQAEQYHVAHHLMEKVMFKA